MATIRQHYYPEEKTAILPSRSSSNTEDNVKKVSIAQFRLFGLLRYLAQEQSTNKRSSVKLCVSQGHGSASKHMSCIPTQSIILAVIGEKGGTSAFLHFCILRNQQIPVLSMRYKLAFYVK